MRSKSMFSSMPARGLLGGLCFAMVGLTASAGLHAAALTNGGFETGDFTGYTTSGFISASSPSSGGPTYQTFTDARDAGTSTAAENQVVMSQTDNYDNFGPFGSTPAVGPTEGDDLAFIANETSAGDGSLTGSSISQSFTLPADAATLDFDVALLNNNLSEDFSLADDFGGVALVQGNTLVDQYNIDLDSSSNADAHVTADRQRGGFFNSTPWLSPTFDVSGLGGQQVALIGYSLQYGGDNNSETRLLLDNVAVTPTAPVPEPTSVAGMGLLAAAALLRRRRRQAC